MAVDKPKSSACTRAILLVVGVNAKTDAFASSLTREHHHYDRGKTRCESDTGQNLLLLGLLALAMR